MQKELLSVRRGECTMEIKRNVILQEIIDGKIKEKDVPNVLKKFQNHKNSYKGAFYSVYFRADRRIFLHALGFYGPFQEPEAAYDVRIEVYGPKSPKQVMPQSWKSPLLAKRKMQVLAKKDEIFFTDFHEPALIEAGKWHLIQFMLDGPDTVRCETIKKSETVESVHSQRKITFEFNEGSKQLPLLQFTEA